LDGEKVDFVENIDDPKELITRLLKPAQINSIDLKDGNKAVVKVDESQKPLAIGKAASNIKLATQLS
jgi:transcription antitermination factor NusA-like protein